jgi:hypothetical protein
MFANANEGVILIGIPELRDEAGQDYDLLP